MKFTTEFGSDFVSHRANLKGLRADPDHFPRLTGAACLDEDEDEKVVMAAEAAVADHNLPAVIGCDEDEDEDEEED